MANLVTAPRKWKNKAILVKLDTAYGTDPVPTGAANWIEARNVSFTPMEAERADRNIELPYLGSAGQILTSAWAKLSFDVAMAGSGAAGTAPKWAPLMLACGFAETVSAGVSATYNLVSSAFSSATAYINIDGALHKLVSARGEAKGKVNAKGLPMLSFELTAIHVGPTDVTLPAVTRTGWMVEEAVNSSNTAKAILNGVDLAYSALEWSLANQLAKIDLPGPQREVAITDRKPTAQITVLAPATLPVPNIRPGFSSAWMFAQTQDEYEWQRTHGTEVYHYLPEARWTGFGGEYIAPAATLNETATLPSAQQMQGAAIDTVIPVTFGRDRLGARLADVGVLGGNLVQFVVWGRGPYDALESFTLANAAPPAGVLATHYDGTQTAPDPTLAAMISGYADVLPGVAYSVIQVPPGVTGGSVEAQAVWRGRKLYDPRSDSTAGGSGAQRLDDPSTWEWRDDWGLILADFIASDLYGMRKRVEWASVVDVLDACDELVSGARRRPGGGLTLDKRMEVRAWLDTLRTYAGCFVLEDGDTVRLVPDRPSAPVKHFSWAAGNLKAIAPLEMADLSQQPTVIEVVYTDTTVTPWREASAIAQAAGVDSGATDIRYSKIALPGIRDASQAMREAVERLDKRAWGNVATEAELFDEGTLIEPGDVVQLSWPNGLAAAEFRVMAIAATSLGRYKAKVTRYAAAMYSDAIASHVSPGETNLPNPANPPAVTGLVVVEEVAQRRDGAWVTRLRATWDDPAWPYLTEFRIELLDPSGTLVWAGAAHTAEAVTDAVTELVTYTLRVACVSSLGVTSAWTAASLTAQGKYLIPSDVASLSGYEIGGEVRLTLGPAVDKDLSGLEVRWGAIGVSWDAATFLDFAATASGVGAVITSRMVPAGEWEFLAAALDSVGQYSTTPARLRLTVTVDDGAFFTDTLEHTSPTLVNMQSYRLSRVDPVTRYVTDDGVDFATKFGAAMGGYENPLASYHASVSSSWRGESEDFGVRVGGQWTAEGDVADINGVHTAETEFSDDGSTWSVKPGSSHKLSARFARRKYSTAGSATMLVLVPRQTVRVQAVPRTEKLNFTTVASGPTVVTLAGSYTKVLSIQLTAAGTAARSASYDNIRIGDAAWSEDDYCEDDYCENEANQFDAYVFDATNTQVAADVFGDFYGI